MSEPTDDALPESAETPSPEALPQDDHTSLNEAVAAASANQAATQAAQLATIFADTGTLATGIPGYRPRASQQKMAEAVAGAIAQNDSVIVEAGTGTGKTFAYLVPAMLWGGKVILSTGTKNLQDQLFLRDIPTVRQALNVPVSVSLLKGRANYLCHYHLERAQANGRLASTRGRGVPARYRAASLKTTTSGDKAELAAVPENAPVWQLVTSTRENCLGSECPQYKECFVMRARREAQQADVVVVNHHLFFADVVLRDTGMAELLPAANTVIFDEAHQLPETATLFFGETLSTSQLLELARDTRGGRALPMRATPWTGLALGAPLEPARARPAAGLRQGQPAAGAGPDRIRSAHARAVLRDAGRAGQDALADFVEGAGARPSARVARAMPPPGGGTGAAAGGLARRPSVAPAPAPACAGRGSGEGGRWRDDGHAEARRRHVPTGPGDRALGRGVLAHRAAASHAAVDRADLHAPARGPAARLGLYLGHAVGEGQFHPLRGPAGPGQGALADAGPARSTTRSRACSTCRATCRSRSRPSSPRRWSMRRCR